MRLHASVKQITRWSLRDFFPATSQGSRMHTPWYFSFLFLWFDNKVKNYNIKYYNSCPNISYDVTSNPISRKRVFWPILFFFFWPCIVLLWQFFPPFCFLVASSSLCGVTRHFLICCYFEKKLLFISKNIIKIKWLFINISK